MDSIDDRFFFRSPIQIAKSAAPNRLVHQPMEGNDSPNGFPSDVTLKRYERLARGRAGITIVEATSVGSRSRARKDQLVIDDEHESGIRQLTGAFRSVNPDSILCYQLTHSGQVTNPTFSEMVRVYPAQGFDARQGRLLSTEDLDRVVGEFIHAAELVYKSGAQMVDVKCCHGYLGANLLRPANTRDDKYGGSLVNRVRFASDIILGIRRKVPGLGIMVRLSLYEGDKTRDGIPIDGGVGTKGPESNDIYLDESLEICSSLVAAGVHALNITAGIPFYNGESWVRPAKPPKGFDVNDSSTYTTYHHFDYARQVKKHLTNRVNHMIIPIIGSGFSVFGKDIGLVGEKAITGGYVDMVGIGRQTLADPDFDRILSGTANYDIRCGGCSKLLTAQATVGCSFYDPHYRQVLATVQSQPK